MQSAKQLRLMMFKKNVIKITEKKNNFSVRMFRQTFKLATETQKNSRATKEHKRKWEKFQLRLGATWQVYFFLIFMLRFPAFSVLPDKTENNDLDHA